MAITIYNMRIVPYTQKDTIKPVYGNTMELTFVLPDPYALGDEYMLGMDYDRTLVPTVRPICAFTNEYTIDNNEITFRLNLNWQRFRDWVSRIKKPTPVWLQMVRKRNEVYTTLLLDDVLALPSIIDGAGTTFPGDPILDLLDRKMDKTEVEGTEGQVLTMGEDGHYAWADLPEIPEQEQANWDESDSSEVSYIRNKPDLNIYVEKEAGKGLSSNDFTNADKTKLEGIEDNAQVNVQADWDDSDSSGDAYIRNKPALSTVAISGSYADLSNKPDLTVYSLITETGNKISMSIDDEYDLVVNLLDKNDNILSTQDIDLPIESMIVDATYASGILTLTLQNGNTVDVDISDIVSGLVPDSRTVNGHALSSDVTITAQDLGLATVATSGSYNDLVDKPVVEQADWDESDSSEASYIKNKPHIPADQVQADWDESDSSEASFILNKPDLSLKLDKPVETPYPSGQVLTYKYVSGQGASNVWENPRYVSNGGYDGQVLKSNGNNTFGWKYETVNSDYLCAEALVDNAELAMTCRANSRPENLSLEISTDKVNWTQTTAYGSTNSNIRTVLATLEHAGDKVYIRGSNPKGTATSGYYYSFSTQTYNSIKLSGNLMTLVDRYGLVDDTTGISFRYLFIYDRSSVDIKLPAKYLTSNCYQYMFSNYSGYNCDVIITVDWTGAFPTSSTSKWLDGSTTDHGALGTKRIFRCPSSLDLSTRGVNTVPASWTIVYTDVEASKIPESPVQSDWDESDSTDLAYIKNKPVIPEQVQADWDESDSSEASFIRNKPNVEPSIDELITFFEDIYHEDSSSASASESESDSSSGSDTPSGATDPFTITLADPTKTQGIRLYRQITTTNWDMQYSYDGNSWISISWEAGANFSSTIRIGNGYERNKVYLRGNNNTNYVAFSDYFVFNTIDQTSATAVKLSGNLYSIFRRTGFEEITDLTTLGNTYGEYGCYSLFRNTDGGGKYLFNCIDAGDLYMNATTLLPGTYNSAFRGSSITRAPHLPATNPASNSYNGMFRDCLNLKEISVAFTTWTNATSGWVSGVGSTGTFKCPSGLDTTLTGANYVPSGWTVENI